MFVRAGVLDDAVGLALLSTFEKAGAFMINNRDGMLTCDNKMSSYITFNQNGIQTPKTSLINNDESVEDAHKRIGGKFPVIIKTITGTQGSLIFGSMMQAPTMDVATISDAAVSSINLVNSNFPSGFIFKKAS